MGDPHTRRGARRAVFLDRDGVVNRNRSDYVRSSEQLELLPGTLDAFRRLAPTDFAVVVVTNQSAVNRGLMVAENLADLHTRLVKRIRDSGGRVEAVYVCPHRPDEECACRKPRPGLFQQAAEDLQLDLPRSFMVGDHASDLAAAQAAGCRPVLVSSGRTLRSDCEQVATQFGCPHFDGLLCAVDWIISLPTTRGL